MVTESRGSKCTVEREREEVLVDLPKEVQLIVDFPSMKFFPPPNLFKLFEHIGSIFTTNFWKR
jgi:hypothetical protein